jgi:hypothetical protein
MAEEATRRIPWPRLLEAREKYIKWQAFVLWVRAIEETEGNFPKWLAETVDRRCRGFLRFVAAQSLEDRGGPSCFWNYLERWINEWIFGRAWREGWMNAVGYYAVRDTTSLRNEAYWEHCERRWKRSKPTAYPSFQEWRKAAEHCSDGALNEYEIREEMRRLVKLSQRVSVRTLRKSVEQYVEWEVFSYWARAALNANRTLPLFVKTALGERCPGFLEVDTTSRSRNSPQKSCGRFELLMKWIEDREFRRAKRQGWFDVVVYQAHLHPLHARLRDYWRQWQADRARRPAARYPCFEHWRAAVDGFTFEGF